MIEMMEMIERIEMIEMIEMEKGMILNQKSQIHPDPFLSKLSHSYPTGGGFLARTLSFIQVRHLPDDKDGYQGEDLKIWTLGYQGTKLLEKLLEKVVNHGFQPKAPQKWR